MKSKAIFVALLALAFGAQAVPVSSNQARDVARRWAARGTRFGVKPGTEVENVSEYALGGGKFFAVRMKGGTVFTAGDTRQNPVLAFTRERIEKLDPKSPLYALLAGSVRLQSLSAAPEPNAVERSAMRQWAELQKTPERLAAAPNSIWSETEIDDVRVSPLLTTKWGQGTVTGEDGGPTNCFNFYTPPTHVVEFQYKKGEHDVVEIKENGNCVCGCVATAMAQLMRYWSYPEGERESFSNKGCSAPSGDSVFRGEYIGETFYISDYENPTEELELSTTAGAYDWANMVDVPYGVGEAVCSAIGKLTYDCGVAVGMDYNVTAAGGSGIFSTEASLIPAALMEKFSYTDAKLCTSYALTSDEACRQRAIFASLDARCPVLLLVSGSGGHAVVGDGYGFAGESGEEFPYVHLNMGWSGQCDVWYNLPNIDTSENPEDFSGFSYIDGAVFNVFTNETGWIVSGRALDKAGSAFPDAKVTLRDADDLVVGETVADAKGIYTFLVPQGGTYDVSAVSPDGSLIADRLVKVSGQSTDGGNSWGNDLFLAEPAVQIRGAAGNVRAQFASLDRALMEATEDGDQVEILSEVPLRRDVATGADFTLVAVEAEAPAITRVDGATISITNGVAFFTNVVFALEKSTPVLVASNGVIAVAGRVELDDVASLIPGIRLEDADGFRVAGELLNGLTIDVEGAREIGDVFGAWVCDSESAAKSAARIVTSANEDFFGSVKDNGTLVWTDDGLLDPLVAVARIDGEEPVYYRSLNRLFSRIEEGSDPDIVVMKSGCSVSNLLTVVGESRIRGEEGETVVNVAGTSAAPQFTIPEGASLTVTNLTFKGYVGKALFWVEGGELALDCGATVDGAVGTADLHSGAVVVRKGVATLREGARLVNCRAEGVGANGGAVWLGGDNCVLNLEGGWIYGCSAATYGGGVFAVAKSTINLSGASIVMGNESGNNSLDNIYLSAANCQFNLTGEAFGWVGVQYAESIAGNAAGDAFIAVDPEVDPEDVELSCEVFTNDKVDGLEATVSEDGANLVWSAVPPYTGEVDPEDAWDLVIYNDGTPQAVTNYYESFEYAYASLTNDATIVVLGIEYLKSDVTVDRNVLIRTDNPLKYIKIIRTAPCRFTVEAGGSLTFENIMLDGGWNNFGGVMASALLYVRDGGSLTLGNGARVFNALGNDGRASGGIVVWGGEFRMLPGSQIYDCINIYKGADRSPAEVGVGGGVLVDGGTAYLEGGIIYGCRAERAAGVYIGNKSTVYISGDMEISDNVTLGGKISNLTVEDQSSLVLVDDFTGSIGVSDGVLCDTNVFGRVDADYYSVADLQALTNSAANFSHDLRDVSGVVATNGTQSAILVWSDAFVSEGEAWVFTDENGVRYEPIGKLPPAPKWEVVTYNPTPIAFKAIERVSDTEWTLVVTDRVEYCNYRLIWTDDLTKGFTSTGAWEHAVGDAAASVWTTNVITTGGACFWRAEGADGTNMVLKVQE